ncbi:MAG: hypothetical protein WAV56_03100 [Microgenomates group bacterium]
MKQYLKIALLVLITTFLVWLPFYLRLPELPGWGLRFGDGMPAVWRNFDGPFYIIVSKTWYNKEAVRQAFSVPLPLEYYPAHLPFYPALIAMFDVIFNGPNAMLFATLAGSVLAFWMFFKYLSDFKLSKNPFWLTVVFLFIPARLLIARSIGAPETWFIFFILASLYLYKKGKFWGAAALGALAQLTKSPGVLLFGAYFLDMAYQHLLVKRDWRKMLAFWPFLLMPLAAVILFSFYKLQTGEFWAYFHSGDNFHLFWPPFSIFSPLGRFWTGDFWLEEVIWLWLIYGLAVARLWRAKLRVEAFFSGIFFFSTLFVAHRDIARYSLPMAPLALIAWKQLLAKKEFKWILALMLVPIFLYSWNFILSNQAPIPDWAPYL